MITITAPTGLIGHQVLENVLKSGEPIRVIVRDPSKLPDEVRKRVEVVQGSHGDINVVTRAFAGADAVFWLVPPDHHAVSVEAAYVDFSRPACEAFKTQGVKRVVGVSALGRGSSVVGHAGLVTASLAMDELIASTGVSYRALANPSFMDNVFRQREFVKSLSMFSWPISGERKFPTCATRDIAAVAAKLLLDSSWDGQGSVPVLGPEDLSINDMALIISEVLGKPVHFRQMPVEEYKAGLTKYGMSAAMVHGMIDMWIAKDNGLDNAEPRTPEYSTPTSFRTWCKEVLKPAVSDGI
jgi:uncharacterized protein YbjT (DUF2867 family)